MSSYDLINIKKATMQIKEIQERLRQIKNSNISQGDIAKAIGTTRSNVSQLFSKNSQLSDDKIEKIENFFGVNLGIEDFSPPRGLIKIPLYEDFGLKKIDRYVYLSDIFTSGISSPLALKVNSNSMHPYINKGDLAIFDTTFEGFEDGEIFLIQYDGNFFIKRILNNLNEIILKSDNADYKDISVPDTKSANIEIIARFRSLLRVPNACV